MATLTDTNADTATTPPAAPNRTRRRSLPSIAVVLTPAAIIVLVAVIGPLLVPYSPTSVVAAPEQPPSAEHWFGTDSYGFDVFSRVIAATRNNITIGLIATAIATLLGIGIGLLTGTTEQRRGILGILGRSLNRALDLFDAIPAVVVGLVLLGFFGRDIVVLSLVTGLLMVPTQARQVRTEVLRVRNEAYLESARMAGDTSLAIIRRHVLPNSIWPAMENMSFVFGVSITIAAGLGFLGVGLAPPAPEWGTMIADGSTSAASGRWWASLFPCVALALTVLISANLSHRYLNSRG